MLSTPLPPDDTAPVMPRAPRGKIVGDPELITMDKINRAIQSLPSSSQARVVAWLVEKLKRTAEPAS